MLIIDTLMEWLNCSVQILNTMCALGQLSRDKLPKDFPKTTQELEDFISKISIQNADKIFNELTETVDEWED